MLRFVRTLHQTFPNHADFSHVVVGGGIVGTAIAASLQQKSNSVLLVEQHESLGTETTSRNSEVVHAGLYYPPDSLKTQLCLRGKHKLYTELPRTVPIHRCGKWVVASSHDDAERLEQLHAKASAIGVDVEWISRASAKKQLPSIHTDYDVLHSPSTGIISVHDLLLFFQTQFENAEGTLAVNTRLEGINSGPHDYSLSLVDVPSATTTTVSAHVVVNAAGLYAPLVANMVLPPHRHYTAHYAKGNYYTYHHANADLRQKLIYPVPNPHATSLGTHLTFDLGGQIKFGPDLEWLDPHQHPADLDYTPNAANLDAAVHAIRRYYPGLQRDKLVPSYSGIRPKYLSADESKKTFADFVIREEVPGFVNLVGIESPGVTSAWAIAEYVAERWA